MSGASTNGTERIAFPHGVLLAARDLEAWAAHSERLRRTHVRSVHDTWGVAIGFEVWRGARGRGVLVGPGLAYDCHGRAIVSARTVVVPAPPLSGNLATFDLLVRYGEQAADAAAECAEDPCSVCEERPRWRWAETGRAAPGRRAPFGEDVRLGEEVPLARLLMAGRLVGRPDLSLRRSVQPLANPVVRAGRVDGAMAAGSPLAWSVRVDTSQAAFLRPPLYFAWLGGDLLAGAIGRSSLLGPFLSLRGESAAGFTLDVSFAAQGDLPAELRRGASFKLKVPIHWLGVHPPVRCPPALRLSNLLDVGGRRDDARGEFDYLRTQPTEGEVVLA